MYIESVKNRNSPPAILLRESYRQNGKVRKRTLCNLSDWPTAHIEGLRGVLRGGTVIPAEQDALTVTRSLPYGHVAAALGTARKIGLDRIVGPDGNRFRDLVIALVVHRILEPAAPFLAHSPVGLRSPAVVASSLNEALGLDAVGNDELYAALDWLLLRQPAIETTLAKRHVTNGTLVLYDVASSTEDIVCPLARRGGGEGTSRVTCGLLCAADGCPVAIEVFDGNAAGDPTILAARIEKLKQRFLLDHVVVIGDCRLITQARVMGDTPAAGLDWITALGGAAIKQLLDSGALQLSVFDQRDMASTTSPNFPGERLVVCRNAQLAAESASKREDLLAATERDLAHIRDAVVRERDPLRGTAEIALAVGAVIDMHKMRRHFDLDITDAAFSFTRKLAEIAAEAAADGISVMRTSLPEAALDDAAIVRSYKSLGVVERAFSHTMFAPGQVTLGTAGPHDPAGDRSLADRVRAQVFLRMLACYLEWHMRQRLAPMLFDDTAETQRASMAAQARNPPAAVETQTTGLIEDKLPVHSFHSLLVDLATLARNTITTAITPRYPLTVLTKPTPVQQKAFDLLGVGVESAARAETS
jgi:hypothetical protein